MVHLDVDICSRDITTSDVDAIVNPTNSALTRRDGISSTIHEKAGPGLMRELKKIRKERYPRGLAVGKAVITKGYNLPARFVIHTVCPKYDPKKDKSKQLYDCFVNSLKLAEKYKLKTIVFPAISTGAYKYPKDECAIIAKKVFDNYKGNSVEKVTICLFTREDYDIFKEAMG